jgi:DNA-binding FadR family transcriptional regulator
MSGITVDPNAQEAINNAAAKQQERKHLLAFRADIIGKMAELAAMSEDEFLKDEKIIAIPSGLVNPQTGQPTMVPASPKEVYDKMYLQMRDALVDNTQKLTALTGSGLIIL